MKELSLDQIEAGTWAFVDFGEAFNDAGKVPVIFLSTDNMKSICFIALRNSGKINAYSNYTYSYTEISSRDITLHPMNESSVKKYSHSLKGLTAIMFNNVQFVKNSIEKESSK